MYFNWEIKHLKIRVYTYSISLLAIIYIYLRVYVSIFPSLNQPVCVNPSILPPTHSFIYPQPTENEDRGRK
jgi:hypothetical protein